MGELSTVLANLATVFLLWRQNKLFERQNDIFAIQAGLARPKMPSRHSPRSWWKEYWPFVVWMLVAALTALAVLGYEYYQRHPSSVSLWRFSPLLVGLVGFALISIYWKFRAPAKAPQIGDPTRQESPIVPASDTSKPPLVPSEFDNRPHVTFTVRTPRTLNQWRALENVHPTPMFRVEHSGGRVARFLKVEPIQSRQGMFRLEFEGVPVLSSGPTCQHSLSFTVYQNGVDDLSCDDRILEIQQGPNMMLSFLKDHPPNEKESFYDVRLNYRDQNGIDKYAEEFTLTCQNDRMLLSVEPKIAVAVESPRKREVIIPMAAVREHDASQRSLLREWSAEEERRRVKSSDWQQLADRFTNGPQHLMATWNQSAAGESWGLDGWTGAADFDALARLAGASLLQSRNTRATLSSKVRTTMDDRDRWLNFLKETEVARLREKVDISETLDDSTKSPVRHYVFHEIGRISSSACIKCAALEV